MDPLKSQEQCRTSVPGVKASGGGSVIVRVAPEWSDMKFSPTKDVIRNILIRYVSML